jgi:hypothetical protein
VRFPPGGGIGLPLEVIALCSDVAEIAVAEGRANHVVLGRIRKPIAALTDIGDYLIPAISFEGTRGKSSDCDQNVDSAVRFQVLGEVQK